MDYAADPEGKIGKTEQVCWWRMSCGRVLGMHGGMLVEVRAEE